jgi:CspA family cold shock protein
MASQKEEGVVKRYDAQRGFGFISRRGAKDVHVGQSEVQKAGQTRLEKGDKVLFNVRETPRGPSAVDLEIFSPLGAGYLSEGYFYQKAGSDKRYLRPELLDSLAMDIAQALGSKEMKSHQLRRFFNKARGIEAKLEHDKDFEAVKADILGFKRDVAYQVGRELAPGEFQQFIERNVDLAIQDKESFKEGFMKHFESVLAYFVYLFRK